MVSHSKNLNKNKGTIHLVVILGIFAVALGFLYILPSAKEDLVTSNTVVAPAPVTLLFVGDIMMDRGVRASVIKNMAGDYGKLFENTDYISTVDIAFANLEGPVAGETGKRSGSRFSFRMDPKSLSAMADAGFDIVSFANNHVGDYSTSAFLETLSHLKENNILFAGAGENYLEATKPVVIDVRGMKVGYLAASDVGPDWLKASAEKPGILLASDPNLASIVSSAKAQVDVIVVSFHWGNEYSPSNSRQEKFAHTVIDAGADIVVGHHPHVMEKLEVYKGKPIFYSLGNFIFDQYFSEHTMRGMVATVSVDPQTYEITPEISVSPISKQYVPQPLVLFDESMLITKTFTP